MADSYLIAPPPFISSIPGFIVEKQEKEFIFITAWNEWGEGAFLEPDTLNKYECLNVIKVLTKKQ